MPFAELRRRFDWWLQNRLTGSAPVLKRHLASLAQLEAALAPAQQARYRELAARYPLAGWPAVCTRREALINLWVLDVLDRHVPRPGAGRCLDIGAGGWSYLPALASFAGAVWDGIELDAHRRDWTLATRRGYAEHMLRLAPDCRYLTGSLPELDGRYAGIAWFLPFITPAAFAASRLPRTEFRPPVLLDHAWSLLAPGGALFVVNQGEGEAAVQGTLFDTAGIAAVPLGELASVFTPFRVARYGWLAVKARESRNHDRS